MLIGFVLASLLKKKKASQALPLIHGKFEVSHSMPGRIRFRVPSIESGAGAHIQTVRNELPKIPEIQSVDVDTRSGSILVHYDAAGIEPQIVCGLLLRIFGLENELTRRPVSAVQKEIRYVADAVNQVLYNSTAGTLDLSSAFVLLSMSLGLYKILIQNDRSLPGGINLLWWAYVMAKRN
jgi:ABC-type microcin C transport system permease subunit YejB